VPLFDFVALVTKLCLRLFFWISIYVSVCQIFLSTQYFKKAVLIEVSPVVVTDYLKLCAGSLLVPEAERESVIRKYLLYKS
jgi:hypothetical protein